MDIQELLSSLPQNTSQSQATGLAPGMAELQQAAALGQMPQQQQQADPLNAVRQQISRTPEDNLSDLWRQYYGLKPGEDKPSKGTKRKKMVQELLMGLFGSNYEAPQDRLRKTANKNYEEETKRYSLGPAFERVDAQREQAAMRAEQAAATLEQRKALDAMRGEQANSKLELQKLLGLLTNDRGVKANNINQAKVDQQTPLTNAKTNLLGVQADNAKSTGGLSGIFGAGNALSQMSPNAAGAFNEGLRQARDNSKFKPEPKAAGGGAVNNRIFSKDISTFNPETGEIETKQVLNAVNPRTLEQTALKGIDLPAGALNPKEQATVQSFTRAAGTSRDLVNNISRAIQNGQSKDFIGLLQGNDLSSAARAKGAFGGKTFSEAMFNSLQFNGMFETLNAYLGKQVSDKEGGLLKKTLAQKSDDEKSALTASIVPALLMEVAQLRTAKVLPLNVDTTVLMENEAQRFIGETMAHKNPKLKTMREILTGAGMLNGTSKAAAPGAPPAPLKATKRFNPATGKIEDIK